jgi:hypothetical protein
MTIIRTERLIFCPPCHQPAKTKNKGIGQGVDFSFRPDHYYLTPFKFLAMKNLSFLAVCFLTIFFISCQKDEFKPGGKTGSLHIDIGLSIRINEVNSRLKSTQQTEDFKVTIYREDGTEVLMFESASAIPDTIELEIGAYYVEAHSDNNLPAAFENPYYYGVSEVFTLTSNTQQSVLVNCTLSNTIVSVGYSDNVVSSFEDYTTTVSSALDSLVFTQGETRMGYFQTLPLDIRVDLAYLNPDGSDGFKTLYGCIPDPLPNRHYEIFVDATIDGGITSFQILLDSSEVLLDVIEITNDPGIPQNGAIGYGDLLITEIMYDPSVLSDTEGEWFEIFNNSGREVNLQNLVLGRDDANSHTITDSIVLLPGEYFVFARSVTATDASNSYIYGSAILLPNTGAVLSIYNEATGTGPGALIFSVNYGGANFPDGTGVSISLNPGMFSASEAILGTSWCLSTSVYNTGDSGTPGVANDACQ